MTKATARNLYAAAVDPERGPYACLAVALGAEISWPYSGVLQITHEDYDGAPDAGPQLAVTCANQHQNEHDRVEELALQWLDDLVDRDCGQIWPGFDPSNGWPELMLSWPRVGAERRSALANLRHLPTARAALEALDGAEAAS